MAGFVDKIRGAYAGARLGFSQPMSVRPTIDPNASTPYLSPSTPTSNRARYQLLRMQKDNTVYRQLSSVLRAVPMPKDYAHIRALENPALEAVRFHVFHVFPGSLVEALPIDLPENDPLRLAANQVFRWSWFGTQKDRLVDVSATYGDAFLNAWSTPDKVGLTVREPSDISEFEEDSEGNIVYIRLDQELLDDEGQVFYRTEAWSKEDNLYARWYHRLGLESPFANLPTDQSAIDSGAYVENKITDFGYDYVPYVRAPFGQGYAPSERSKGVFENQREAIDDLLRSATVLRDRYFRHGKPLWQSVTDLDKPVDYVEALIEAQKNKNPNPESGRMPDNETFVRNPQGTKLEALIPQIDWAAGLAQIEDSRLALERSMPELRFFRGHDSGDPSGAAMDKHQSPAIRSARAARGNYEEAILKATKMCLSMGVSRRLFPDIGSYQGGGFDELTFKPRPIVPETEEERLQTLTAKANAYAAAKDVSPEWFVELLVSDGYDEERAREFANSSEAGDDPTRRIADVLAGGLS